MMAWLGIVAFPIVALSAVALYAASPHCMWRVLRGRPRAACVTGFVLTLLSLPIWIHLFGVAAGLSAMLMSLMLALTAQPYLALFVGTPAADVISMEGG